MGLIALPYIQAEVTSGSCGDHLQWSYNSETKALVITGYGDMFDYSIENRPWSSIGSEATSISLPEGLTHIGNCAFRSFVYVPEITIPTTVTSIGVQSFMENRKTFGFGNQNQYP